MMNQLILNKLSEIEQQHDVRILFAVESGSRAWGFASPDSDYDVRFIYTHTEDFYLSVYDQRDTIEMPVDEILDISGWDIRRALRFIYRTNAVMYEWCQSPVIYLRHTTLLDQLREISPQYFSPAAGLHHYLSLTGNTLEKHMQDEVIPLKKYFYALRPIMAAIWICRYQTIPPMDLASLRIVETDAAVNSEIDALLRLKATSDEKSVIAANPILHDYIYRMIGECRRSAPAMTTTEGDWERLNVLFRTTMRQAFQSP